MEYVKISEVRTLRDKDGFIIEFEEKLGYYIYISPDPDPDQQNVDVANKDDKDDDNKVIWF